ncbi:MAG: L-aspartate oxidase, partial [Candidatus Eremiobacteraeota bacterium]|nr:L-aspartate oxidase [Candidatus Eremiobacteraeota bacterium]
ETSATGVHGANRLASNSLLEALVYGTRVATDIANRDGAQARPPRGASQRRTARGMPASTNATQTLSDLRNVMYSNVGLVRNDAGLDEAVARIAELQRLPESNGAVLRNLLVVGRLIAEAALERRESRGSHYRSDYPTTDEAFAKRSFTRLRDVA